MRRRLMLRTFEDDINIPIGVNLFTTNMIYATSNNIVYDNAVVGTTTYGLTWNRWDTAKLPYDSRADFTLNGVAASSSTGTLGLDNDGIVRFKFKNDSIAAQGRTLISAFKENAQLIERTDGIKIAFMLVCVSSNSSTVEWIRTS